MKQHLILSGLPGAGKSTVGALVAGQLGCGFVDLDRQVEAATGTSIPDLFAARGESGFRELEREAMDAALAGSPAVIASGGGWAAQPGNMDAVRGRALVVYLAVAPAAAAARLAGAGDRPLLVGGNPRLALERLLEAREPFYRLADAEVDGDAGSPELVAASVHAVVRGRLV